MGRAAPRPPVACGPLARPERPRRHPRKGLAIEKKSEEVPARPEMRPQSGCRGLVRGGMRCRPAKKGRCQASRGKHGGLETIDEAIG